MNPKQILITRLLNAPVSQVWKVWTTPEGAKKWWGPEGFSAPSIKMDLRVGGKYIFGMKGPDGSIWDTVMYSAGVYREIVPHQKIVITDFLSDEHGNPKAPETFGLDSNFPPTMTLAILFEEREGNRSQLSIVYAPPDTPEQMDAMVNCRLEDGWNSSLNKLEKCLI